VTDVMASNAEATATRDTTIRSAGAPSAVITERELRVPRVSVSVAMGAFLALLLSAWAGIVPFVGPALGFSADGTSSWTWNEVHALGALVPGAVGVLACVLMFASIRRPMALGTWGFFLFLCGAWLTVAPVVWPVLVGTYFHAATPSMTLVHWMAYSSGPGILLAAFGAYVMGRGRRTTLGQTSVA
jgi:hypothetical protein